ncbi:MAG: LegC family aminotransferase [Lentisphaerales bacterium]|nr:LegC family aminotransferase [Lentisphaerales bacterium]
MGMVQNEKIISFIRSLYNTDAFIPLHEPTFSDLEKEYVNEAIDSTFVSSVGGFVNRFEKEFADFVGAKYAVAVVNGTAALHTALLVSGVLPDDEVITQPLTFVATCNAISYCGATPVFVDVDEDTMGLSPIFLRTFLAQETIQKNGECVDKKTSKVIRACVPMHTFGNPTRIEAIAEVCQEFNISLVEDAAESLGSFRKNQHTGTFGALGVFSFNGNKIMTTGGGGMLVTDNQEIAQKAKHLTTTAKVPHKWNFDHNQIGYNYRMPNLNAALGCAQLVKLPEFLRSKRALASQYEEFFETVENCHFVTESSGSKSNYWLNTLKFNDAGERDSFLKSANDSGVMSRPCWTLMHELPMYAHYQRDDELLVSRNLSEKIVNIPSSPILERTTDTL